MVQWKLSVKFFFWKFWKIKKIFLTVLTSKDPPFEKILKNFNGTFLHALFTWSMRKIFSSIIRDFSWVSWLKNGSQGSFWGRGNRQRPRNGRRVHFSIKIPKRNRELYEMNFLTLRENHAWRRMLFYIFASFCSISENGDIFDKEN